MFMDEILGPVTKQATFYRKRCESELSTKKNLQTQESLSTGKHTPMPNTEIGLDGPLGLVLPGTVLRWIEEGQWML